MAKLAVLLTTEGTYPYHKGGVSTWCDALTRQLSDVEFTLLAVAMHPYLKPSYRLHANVRQLITVPLWGIESPAEFRFESAFSTMLQRRWQSNPDAIARFVPALADFLHGVVDSTRSLEVAGRSLVAMHDYFAEFDYDETMRSSQVWELVSSVLSAGDDAAAGKAGPTLAELVSALRLLYHLLQPLTLPLPECDLTHSSAAAFCGLPCIVAKRKSGVPFLLTEHGVYVREQYLALRRSIRSSWVRRFMCKLVALVARLNYHHADLLAPVCAYNARWEEWWGVSRDRIRVIFNGADPDRFCPGPSAPSSRPVVCSIGLIYPLKGQLDLIEAAAWVRERIPDVEFRIYGAASDEKYFAACRQRVVEKGLQQTVQFAGQTVQPWQALRSADVVAMASVSEAFPYSIIEAMLTGAAIVATDVGGVREALGDTGVLVPPRQPAHMADAIVSLITNGQLRRTLGAAARLRALQHFTERTFADSYRQAYRDVTAQSQLAKAS